MAAMNEFKLQGYITIVLFVIGFFILLAMIVHLIQIAIRKNKDHTAGMLFFLIGTICAIVSFEITCVLTIYVTSQIMLIHSHSSNLWLNTLYYESLFTMHYLIPTLYTFGHLCVVLVFITRFQYTFHSGYFMASSLVIRVLYIILLLLLACSLIICTLIILRVDPCYVIIAELLWEVAVEIVCIWILYLFLSKLYYLLQMQSNHDYKPKDKHFVDHLERTIKASLESSNPPHAGNETKTITRQITPLASPGISPQHSLRSRMTIDGVCVTPHKLSPIGSNGSSTNHSPLYKIAILDDPAKILTLSEEMKSANRLQFKLDSTRGYSEPLMYAPDHKEVETNDDNNAVLNHMSPSFSKAIPTLEEVRARSAPITPILPSIPSTELASAPPAMELTRARSRSCASTRRHSAGMHRNADLIKVMIKMTLLVSITVIMSTLSVIGNVVIEIHELNTIDKHDIDLKYLWAELLPLVDIILTSFMLYCHFHFTDKVYRTVMGQLEILFLKICLSILDCVKKRNQKNNDVVHQQNSVETPHISPI